MGTDGNQQSASQMQPRRHLVVTSLRQFWSRRHLNQRLQGPSLSAANPLSHAVADVLLISNYRQLQTATSMEITINQVKACYSGGLDSSRVKRHYFYRGPYQNTKLVASLVRRQKQLLVYTLLSTMNKNRSPVLSTMTSAFSQNGDCHGVALFTDTSVHRRDVTAGNFGLAHFVALLASVPIWRPPQNTFLHSTIFVTDLNNSIISTAGHNAFIFFLEFNTA